MTGAERDERALAIRDHVLRLMKATPNWQMIGGTRVQSWRQGEFSAILHGPILNQGDGRKPIQAWLVQEPAVRPLPCYLTVWRDGQVLSIEWDPTGEVRIINFERGEWEEALLSL